jgi:hypothetical protein
VAFGYAEPVDDTHTRPLDLVSLYPPRRDVLRCGAANATGCADTADVSNYAGDARSVMPDIDTVTMATAPGGDMEQSILVAVPDSWADGDYVAWAEVNTEGDSNASYTFKTPTGPTWDSWAESYGYSYRGQPSVAFSVPFTLSAASTTTVSKPTGYGDVDGYGGAGGTLHPIDASITDDPSGAPGSGADRFRLLNGYRFKVSLRVSNAGTPPGTGGAGGQGATGSGGTGGAMTGGGDCSTSTGPAAPGELQASPVDDDKNSYQWGTLRFLVPASSHPIHNYEVRVGTTEITTSDPQTFSNAVLAVSASLEGDALVIPTTGAAGTPVNVNFGGLTPLTSYYVAVRAIDDCAVVGPYAVSKKFTTTKINFTKLSGCFVATAAYGSALSSQVESLRVARDVLRRRSQVFAAATDLYYRSGPAAAAVIARSDATRAVVRTLLGPLVDIAGAAEAVTGTGR